MIPPPQPTNPVVRTYMGWQEYFTQFHNCVEPNWGSNAPRLIVEESSDRTSQSFQTLPQSEIKVELSGNEANVEEAEADLEGAGPHEEQPEPDLGQSIDAWPEADQALDNMFTPHLAKD